MNFCLRVVIYMVVILSPCRGDDIGRLKQVLLSALNDNGQLSTIEQQQITDTARNLKADELRSLLPLGMECLRSSHGSARAAGVALFRGAEENSDGSLLLEAYVSDFAECLKISSCFYRGWAISWLLTTTYPPKPSEAAAAVLVSNLEDEADADVLHDGTVAGSLLMTFPSDTSMRRRLLKFVERRSDSLLTSEVVRALRKVKQFAPEDLTFIRSCLADDNPWVLAATIDLLADIDSNVREQFMERINAIAAEPQGTDVGEALERFFKHVSQSDNSNPSKP